MRIVPDAELDFALKILREGGVIAHATETCYGLACDLTNPEAVKRLFLIKNRPEDQPVSALFSSLEEAKKYVEWSERAEELAKDSLPGPLTLILPIHTPSSFTLFITQRQATSSQLPTTIGIRISSHPIAQELARRFGKPLSTTSANVHGQANPYSVADLEAQFGQREHQPDLILDSGALQRRPPSTIIDLTTEEERIIRSQPEPSA